VTVGDRDVSLVEMVKFAAGVREVSISVKQLAHLIAHRAASSFTTCARPPTGASRRVRARPGRPSACSVCHSKSVCMVILCGHAGCSMAQNGGFRPGSGSGGAVLRRAGGVEDRQRITNELHMAVRE
jgi:hypothetical protein